MSEPVCPRCLTTLTWHEGWGYRCGDCYLFVCIPKVDPSTDQPIGGRDE